MTDWDLIVNEVLNKNKPNATFYFIHKPETKGGNGGSSGSSDSKKKQSKKKKTTKPSIALGPKFPNIKFTAQEAECMKLALRGKTIVNIAETLNLSVRTAEFYMQKMRRKTGTSSKAELIEKILESDFIKNCQEQARK